MSDTKMMSEAEMRELLADLELSCELYPGNAFAKGLRGGISYVLGAREVCHEPGCPEDHELVREQAFAAVRARAKRIRHERAAQERASRQ